MAAPVNHPALKAAHLNLNEVDAKTEASQVQILSLEEFEKVFSEVKDCEMDAGSIGQGFCTTSLAAGIAVYAVGFLDGKPVRQGFFRHSIDSEAFAIFLEKMQQSVHSVQLSIFEGFGNNTIAHEIIKQSGATVVYQLTNPWGVNLETYNDHEGYFDLNYHFAMSVGITPEGKIYLADETNGAKAGSFVTDHPAR